MATVSRLTGFKPELLRAWENRHHLLTPTRGPGGQRLYSDKDLAILQGVRALLDQGRSIGEIAAMGRRQLMQMAPTAASPAPTVAAPWPAPSRADGGAARAMQIAGNAVSRLSARLDPAQLLQLVTETLAIDFQAALARVWVSDPADGNLLLLRASAGLSRQTTTSTRARIDLRTYRFKVGVVARGHEPFVSSQIVGDPDFDQRWVHKERLASVAVMPLLVDDALYGVLASFFRVAINDEVLGAVRMFSAVAAACLAAHHANGRRDRLSA